MIKNAVIIRNMSKEAYKLNPLQVNQKLRHLPKWPSDRTAVRMLSIKDSMDRLAKTELAELVYIGFVLMIETEDKRLWPVRTFDFMTGLNSDDHVEIAKSDMEFLRRLKGPEALLDELRS